MFIVARILKNPKSRFGSQEYYWIIPDVIVGGEVKTLLLTDHEMNWATRRPKRSPNDVPGKELIPQTRGDRFWLWMRRKVDSKIAKALSKGGL